MFGFQAQKLHNECFICAGAKELVTVNQQRQNVEILRHETALLLTVA